MCKLPLLTEYTAAPSLSQSGERAVPLKSSWYPATVLPTSTGTSDAAEPAIGGRNANAVQSSIDDKTKNVLMGMW